MKTLRFIIFFLIIGIYSCTPKYIVVEVTYLNGEKETVTTQQYTGCGFIAMLRAGCTECMTEARCGVRSVKILKYL